MPKERPSRPVRSGADPNTERIGDQVDLDEKRYVRTGSTASSDDAVSPYATSLPGVFAVGDVRANSIKRVASSVGEGSVVVSAIHEHLRGVSSQEER